jgi:hypothetical protein
VYWRPAEKKAEKVEVDMVVVVERVGCHVDTKYCRGSHRENDKMNGQRGDRTQDLRVISTTL